MELAKDLVAPPQLQQESFRERVMYFGRIVNSQIHYHPAGSALLFMLYGCKIVCLYPPDQTDNLYKVPRANFSAITIGNAGSPDAGVDLTQYPKFAQAQRMEVAVNPGDVLFIPIYWWHSIQNVDGVSISAVYFWRLPRHSK